MPVFTRPETVEMLLDCWRYQRENQNLKLYGYVVLENHCHFIAQAENLSKCVSRFKSYTARRIIDLLKERKAALVLKRLRFAKLAHKQDRDYQFWQEGVHAELILSGEMMRQKLDYIHANSQARLRQPIGT